MFSNSKRESRKRRQLSLRKRISGTAERPRVAVFRSARHIYVQVVNDTEGKTLLAMSDLDQAVREASKGVKKKAVAKQVGAALAKKCLEKGIDKVVLDRAGFKYHGRISALADAAREAGLKF